jgi:hypothetical protein
MMRKLVAIVLIVSSSFLLSNTTVGQGITPTNTNTVYLLNPTNGRVIFYLEGSKTSRTEQSLDAGESAEFSGGAGETFLNIEINSNGGKVKYGLNLGSKHHFAWRGNTLDLFRDDDD